MTIPATTTSSSFALRKRGGVMGAACACLALLSMYLAFGRSPSLYMPADTEDDRARSLSHTSPSSSLAPPSHPHPASSSSSSSSSTQHNGGGHGNLSQRAAVVDGSDNNKPKIRHGKSKSSEATVSSSSWSAAPPPIPWLEEESSPQAWWREIDWDPSCKTSMPGYLYDGMYNQPDKDPDGTLNVLLRHQVPPNSNKTVVLLAFSYAYHEMLSNMLCRFQQLNVKKYVIAALDADAWVYCRERRLPCFAATHEVRNGDITATATDPLESYYGLTKQDYYGARDPLDPEATHNKADDPPLFGSDLYKKLVRVKSLQALRILRCGYDVIFTDLDVFWKQDPFEQLAVQGPVCGDADICVQSDTAATEPAGVVKGYNMSLCSGFYRARSSKAVLRAFDGIVNYHRSPVGKTQSEQPAFYRTLCGANGEYVTGGDTCENTHMRVRTRTLPKHAYVNGDERVLKDHTLTRTSTDGVIVAHYNWNFGYETKMRGMYDAGMWLLGMEGSCMCRGPDKPSVMVDA